MNSRIETRTPDVVREWYFEERVVVFVIKNSDRETVDRFADWIIETVTPWPPAHRAGTPQQPIWKLYENLRQQTDARHQSTPGETPITSHLTRKIPP